MDLATFTAAGTRLARRARRTGRCASTMRSSGAPAATTSPCSTTSPTEEERDLLTRAMAWQQEKFDAGYGALTWPVEHGGAGLDECVRRCSSSSRPAYRHPRSPRDVHRDAQLVAPIAGRCSARTELKEKLLRRLLRTEVLSCQLFSEPGAGSDLGVAHDPRRA